MDLKSSDVEVQQKAVEKADCYIAALDEPCRIKVNKTTINTNPSLQASLVKTDTQSHPQIAALHPSKSHYLYVSHCIYVTHT